MSMQDKLTIIGAIAGIICGGLIGRIGIYTKLVKTNMIGLDPLKDHPSNNLNATEKIMVGFVGGLFTLIGLCIIGITPFVPMEGNSKGMLITFGFICAGIGGLVLSALVSGKRVS